VAAAAAAAAVVIIRRVSRSNQAQINSHVTPSIVMSNGAAIPQVGYGLYLIPGSEAEEATRRAIRIGYRHFDSASFYANEIEVGRALAESGLSREELFVASKVWTDCIGLGPTAVRSSVMKSLKSLQLEYLDLVYVHWPVQTPLDGDNSEGLPAHVLAYRALEEMCLEGKIKAIGLSNYRISDYEDLLSAGPMKVHPVVNQIEVNPFLYRKDTINYFKGKNIVTVAYKPFVRGSAIAHPALVAIAGHYEGVTPGEVLLRWATNHGLVVLPKSTNPARMLSNLGCITKSKGGGGGGGGGWDLAPSDMAALDALTTEPEASLAFEAHFSKRAVVDRSGPTLALGYGP